VIKYDLSVQGNVELSVFDVAGRRVKQLVTGEQPAGRYRVIWDGTDDRGHDAASGVYFYRLETRGGTFDRKMILVR
jgi:flagellar hook assembly protein FlgD